MATIIRSENGKKFRALIRQKAFKKQISKTFATKKAAMEWAAQFDRFKKTRGPLRGLAPVKQGFLVAERFPGYEAILGFVRDTPSFSGIYFLFDGDEIVYVGQSKNVWKRLAQHSKDKLFNGYTVLSCDPASLDDIEKHYIKEFSPKYNQQHLTKEEAKHRRKEMKQAEEESCPVDDYVHFVLSRIG